MTMCDDFAWVYEGFKAIELVFHRRYNRKIYFQKVNTGQGGAEFRTSSHCGD